MNYTDLLINCIAAYKKLDYQLIDVPYHVPHAYVRATLPEGRVALMHSATDSYVGSAEQSFLLLSNQGKLKPGERYQALTPCSRDEEPDETHLRVFLKLELFELLRPLGTDDHGVKAIGNIEKQVINIAQHAHVAYAALVDEDLQCDLVKTDDDISLVSYDLYLGGMEIGSYGVRQMPDSTGHYLYGTGLALPRFEQAHRAYLKSRRLLEDEQAKTFLEGLKNKGRVSRIDQNGDATTYNQPGGDLVRVSDVLRLLGLD